MALSRALLIARVSHARSRPARNVFCYRVYYLCFALKDFPQLARLFLFSLRRFHWFSLRPTDYGAGGDPEGWIRQILIQHGVNTADGDAVLLTMPRILGYAFNPVSFWFCLDRAGALRAVLADVKNTFGERHAYLLFHDDQRIIQPNDILASRKVFHVSPFIEVQGRYEFRFAYTEERIGVWIDHYDMEGLLLSTSLTGHRQALTSTSLFYCFFRYPLVTFKVIALIHYQALVLVLKGVRYRRKPLPPTTEITR